MVEPNNTLHPNEVPSIITTNEFNSKFRSKREVYQFLAFDVGAYLPSFDSVTIWHLRDLGSG